MSAGKAIDEGAVVVLNPRLAARVIDGRAVVVVIDSRRIHTLNEVGTRVFELLDGRPVGAVADVIVQEFEVTREQALSDIGVFVEELVGAGAARVEPR